MCARAAETMSKLSNSRPAAARASLLGGAALRALLMGGAGFLVAATIATAGYLDPAQAQIAVRNPNTREMETS
jgi:hypothetical protein